MKKILALSCALALTLTAGCGGCSKKKSDTETINPDNPLSVLSGIGKMAETMQAQTEEITKRIEERRQRGDTLAIPYQDLQKYLPTSITGYEKDGDPTGETTSMMGYSISTCSQNFKKGTDHLSVTVSDYATNFQGLQMLTSIGGMVSTDSDKEKMGKFDIGIPHTTAIENYQKKTKYATITVTTGYRFLVEVKGDNQPDTDAMKSVAKNLNLKELSEK
jgi:hypothetical protein